VRAWLGGTFRPYQYGEENVFSVCFLSFGLVVCRERTRVQKNCHGMKYNEIIALSQL
jgi:hypothetical protein